MLTVYDGSIVLNLTDKTYSTPELHFYKMQALTMQPKHYRIATLPGIVLSVGLIAVCAYTQFTMAILAGFLIWRAIEISLNSWIFLRRLSLFSLSLVIVFLCLVIGFVS